MNFLYYSSFKFFYNSNLKIHGKKFLTYLHHFQLKIIWDKIFFWKENWMFSPGELLPFKLQEIKKIGFIQKNFEPTPLSSPLDLHKTAKNLVLGKFKSWSRFLELFKSSLDFFEKFQDRILSLGLLFHFLYPNLFLKIYSLWLFRQVGLFPSKVTF